MTAQTQTYQLLLDRLHQLRQAQKRMRCYEGMVLWLTILLSCGIALLVLEGLFYLTPVYKWCVWCVVLLVAFIGAAGLWGRTLLHLFFRKTQPSNDALAIQIGNRFPEIRDRLVDAMQVFRETDAHPDTSKTLAELSLFTASETSQSIDFLSLVSSKNLIRRVRRALVPVFILVPLFLLFPQFIGQSWHRFSHPGEVFIRPLPYGLSVDVQPNRVIRDEPVTLHVQATGMVSPETDLIIRASGKADKMITREPPFQYSFTAPHQDFICFARSGRIKSKPIRIPVHTRPLVRHLQVSLLPPAYTRLKKQLLASNTGHIEALPGSQAFWTIQANKPLRSAQFVFNDSTTHDLKTRGLRATLDLPINRSSGYVCRLKDTLGIRNKNPIHYQIQLIPDFMPGASIIKPGKDVDFDESMRLLLTVEAEDDFGFTNGRIRYWKADDARTDATQDTLTLTVPVTPDQTKFLQEVVLNLEAMEIYPEDRVGYLFEIFDNDVISGPKRGQSKIYYARFPSIDEIYAEIDQEQEYQLSHLDSIFIESRMLQQDLEQLSGDLKAGQEMGWEKEQKLEQNMQSQKALLDEIDALQERLENMIDRMEKNDLADPEVLSKYQDLQELYSEIATPELENAMQQMQSAMEKMNPQELQMQLEHLEFNQDAILKSMDRTIALLKRLQAEQKMEEALKRMDALVEKQSAINEALDASESASDSLQQAQESVSNDMEKLKEEMADLHQKMSEVSEMPMAAMDSLMQAMQDSAFQKALSDIQKMMQQNPRDAHEKGAALLQQMQSMQMQMQAIRQQMTTDQKKKVMQAMQRNTQRLLTLSRAQEKLNQQSRKDRLTDHQTAEQQMEMMQNLKNIADSLYSLSQQTFAISPQTGQALGKAQTGMHQSMAGLQQGNQNLMQGGQQSALGGVNEAVMALTESMNQMAGSGSGTGGEQFMMGLGQLSRHQMALNRQLMEMLGQGALTLSQQAAMQRLATKQAELQRQLRDMLGEYGDRSDIAGRLEQLLEEMQSVVEDLEKTEANRKTLRRQQRIVTRLLEAQKSLHRQDYSRKRQAVSGDNRRRQSPEAYTVQKNRLLERIRRDLLRLRRQGYTRDYEKLIRHYFEALSREVDR